MEPFEPQPDPRDASRRVVMVPIYSSPGHNVVMDEADYIKWVATHGIRNPRIRDYGNTRSVVFKTRAGRQEIVLGRFILDNPKGRQVSVQDGDPLNLRRSNLIMRAGGAGGMTYSREGTTKDSPFPPGTAGKQYHRWLWERAAETAAKPPQPAAVSDAPSFQRLGKNVRQEQPKRAG